MGEYVIVHVGFAISRVDEAEAREIFSVLDEIGPLVELEEQEAAGPGGPSEKPGGEAP